jgi:hypothetical protein
MRHGLRITKQIPDIHESHVKALFKQCFVGLRFMSEKPRAPDPGVPCSGGLRFHHNTIAPINLKVEAGKPKPFTQSYFVAAKTALIFRATQPRQNQKNGQDQPPRAESMISKCIVYFMIPHSCLTPTSTLHHVSN